MLTEQILPEVELIVLKKTPTQRVRPKPTVGGPDPFWLKAKKLQDALADRHDRQELSRAEVLAARKERRAARKKRSF